MTRYPSGATPRLHPTPAAWPAWTVLASRAAPSGAGTIGGVLLIAIGLTTLAGWFAGLRPLTAVRPDYIPVAPNTALLFVVLGAVLCATERTSRGAAVFARGAIAFALVVAGSRLLEYLIGVDLDVDRWLFSFPSESLGLAPVGKMAFFTASLFVLGGVALAGLAMAQRPRWLDDLVRALALLVTLSGLVFLLGYAYGSPLLYGRQTIPMALLTALAFVVLGLSIFVPAALRDRAERRAAERVLRASHEELERRVAERTADLESANEELRLTVADLEEQTIEAELAIDEARQAVEALRESQEQLRQAQKMEAVGQLAGGIAHDFNNMLTAIRSFSELLLDDMPDSSAHRGDVGEILRAADRAAALTRQLLAFSRRQLLQPVPINLNVVIGDMEELLGRLLGEDVDCVWRLTEDLAPALADPGQIEQIVMNLAVNARDAMPDAGRLTIQTTNATLDEAYAARVGDMAPGQYVVLVVSDTGTGMDAATQKRIFEPFFTTKEAGKGTGLGLSTVYGIVKQSNGHIAVYSELGRGTTFRVYLPRADAPAVESPARADEPQPMQGGNETILLVEDDPAVRLVATRILERQGYRVLEAPGPVEAEALVARHPGAIDLVLTDLVLPGMSGRDLAELLTTVEPGLRVLYMSGYTDDAVIRRGLLDPGMAFLSKPFTVEEVARKVRATLDAA
ncbi:MAG TPA: ATP-binding protein [Gemmatimonadaceae bacterium]|nr:ATP-binding protein [Gemmatimonadaceae bacterium]